MVKRLRTSPISKLPQFDIIRAENNDQNNSSSSSNQRETKKNKNLSFIRQRETDTKFKTPSIDTINFPFKSNSKTFNLKRYFINGNERDLFEDVKEKGIYNIFIDDNKLFFTEYNDINKNYYEGQVEKENGLFETQNEELISFDIEGFEIDTQRRKINDYKSIFCDNIDLYNFLFIDDNKNYYYINYNKFKDIFDLFKSIYRKQLQLELYDDKILKTKEDIENFIENDEDEEEYIRQLRTEKSRQTGGNSIKRYKKILKMRID